MKLKFVLFTAMKYFRARRKSRGFASSLLSILGVAVGVLTLTVVIGVMNGFQLSYINNILEISSYHLQITRAGDRLPLSDAQYEALQELPGVTAVVPYTEFQVLVNRTSMYSQTSGGIVRAIDVGKAGEDSGFLKSIFSEDPGDMTLLREQLALLDTGSIIIGNLYEYTIGARAGTELILTSVQDMKMQRTSSDDGAVGGFNVARVFKSGYSEIDMNYIFMSLKTAERFFRERQMPVIYGIKLDDRFDDLAAKQRVEKLLSDQGYVVLTWRDFNKGFFGALLMEKIAMMVLVGLIFIVVGFNIFNALRRMVYEKYEEIGLLKAIGASPGQVRSIFIFEGFLTGFIGALSGLVTGLVTASHINEVFAFGTGLVNGVIGFTEAAAGVFVPQFSLPRVVSPFSPEVFYLKEVPSQVLPAEAFLIFFFALFASTAAAFIASRKISEIRPAEVLRYE